MAANVWIFFSIGGFDYLVSSQAAYASITGSHSLQNNDGCSRSLLYGYLGHMTFMRRPRRPFSRGHLSAERVNCSDYSVCFCLAFKHAAIFFACARFEIRWFAL